MKLPFAEQAVVERAKIVDYLLSPIHPEGKSKARFFFALGFRSEEPEALERALRQLAVSSDMAETVFEFGRKYAGVGPIDSPSGRQAQVMTVWVLRNGLPPPILVTAYPA